MTNKEAIEYLEMLRDEVWNEDSDGYEYAQAIDVAIEALSKEIVRCKDCKYAQFTYDAPPECRWYCKNSVNFHSGSFFCSLGERKDK